jgi:hypothetical protein
VNDAEQTGGKHHRGIYNGGKKMQFFPYPRHQAGAIEVAVALFSIEGARSEGLPAAH